MLLNLMLTKVDARIPAAGGERLDVPLLAMGLSVLVGVVFGTE
jgi:hypothetical protein